MYWAYCQEIQNPVFCVQVELKSILKVFVITFLIKEPPCLAHTHILKYILLPQISGDFVQLNKYKD